MTKDASKVCDKKQCEVYDSKKNLIGKWNMKYIKHTYLLESFKSIKFDTNIFMDEMRRDFMARAIANYINKELPKLKLYRLVIEFIKSENTYRYPNNKSISIQSMIINVWDESRDLYFVRDLDYDRNMFIGTFDKCKQFTIDFNDKQK